MPVLRWDAGIRVLIFSNSPGANSDAAKLQHSVLVLRWKRVRIPATESSVCCTGVLGRGILRRKVVPKHVCIFLKTDSFGGLIMRTWLATAVSQGRHVATGFMKKILPAAALLTVGATAALAQPAGEAAGGEASLKLPDLSSVSFLNGAIDGHRLLLIGILFCIFGLGFGMVIYMRLKNLPVHRSMREISELIYETCKTYLVTQGRFILLLWAFIAAIIVLYFGVLRHFEIPRVVIILVFSLVGIAGSYGVAWFGIRVNTFANSRTAFASLPGKPYP